MAKRTGHRSSAGKKLYAVRFKAGKFKDIQTFERAHRADLARTSKAETTARAKKVRAAKKARAVKKAPAVKKASSVKKAAIQPVAKSGSKALGRRKSS